MAQVFRDAVGNRPLEFCPDELVRVKLRGIAGERMDLEATVSIQQALNAAGPVDPAPIPQQDHRALEVPQEMSEELSHFFSVDVLVDVESQVQSQPLSLRGDTDCRDGRDLGPAASHRQPGRLAPGSPGSGNRGNEQKTAFIEENQMGSKLFGLFLYAATGNASNARWPFRPAPGHASPASGNSTPNRPSISRRWTGSSVLQNAFGSPSRYEEVSTGPWSNRPPRDPGPTLAPRILSPAGSIPQAVRESAGPASRCAPVSDGLEPNELRSSSWRPLSSLRCGTSSQTSTRPRRNAVAFPDVPGLHGVSCP